MPELTEYKVMMLSPRIKSTEELFNNLRKGTNGTDGLDVCINAYKTEMSLMTGLPESMFNVGAGAVCVAFAEDFRVFGFITVGIDDRTRVLCTEHAYVRPEVRNKGVYTLMMKRVEKMAKDMKFDRIASFVFNENDVSKTAHEKTGFKPRMIGYIKEVENENNDRG